MATSNKVNTKIRFVHNVYNGPSVDVYLQKTEKLSTNDTNNTKDRMDKIFALNLQYRDITAYSNIKGGYYKILIKNSNKTIISDTFKFGSECTYTILINGSLSIENSLSLYKYKDITTCPKPGKTNLTFIHGLCGAGPVDIYVNNITTPILTNIAYTKSGIASAKVGQSAIPGSQKIYVNIGVKSTNNTENAENADMRNFYAVSGGNYTLILTGEKSLGPTKPFLISTISSHNNKGECQNLQKNFNVDKYMGVWYQISAIKITYPYPTPYSQTCIRSEANYTQLNDRINVYNICYGTDGSILNTINGSAIPYACNPAELVVSFPDMPKPQYANYLIHSTDYVSYAVVGSPTLTSCYILSRNKTMCKKEYKKLLNYCKNLGYDTNNLIIDKDAIDDKC
jgi:lipocalin